LGHLEMSVLLIKKEAFRIMTFLLDAKIAFYFGCTLKVPCQQFSNPRVCIVLLHH
jgi:hypothetical protein